MGGKILCVAEKPSIAKAVANHLGSTVQTRNVSGLTYVKNYDFSFNFGQQWGTCNVIMTSVAGHVSAQDFEVRHQNWASFPPHELFEARIVTFYDGDKKKVAENIERQARGCRALFIWTDCDREGEHIGTEIRQIVWKVNQNIQVKRARFSNIEKTHVLHAAKHPVDLDERQAQAVSARIELDLRIGSCFTRMQTLNLKPLIEHLQDMKAISYGSCQFPTLGFVVDRYFRVQRFKPEPFWKIQIFHKRHDIKVTFSWKRGHLFDRMIVTILFERCLKAEKARVVDLNQKPTSKWKPYPLTTVELQKVGSRFLRMDSQKIMQVAEQLYNRGLISYPRTETDQFPPEMNLRDLVQKQVESNTWGAYAQALLGDGFSQPRAGRHNDQAHPPIHPVVHCAPAGLKNDEERKLYEFVVRRFLACCSEDAKGQSTTVTLKMGPESFSAFGLIVLERNYLDVYPYDKWESSKTLPKFELHEEFIPDEAKMSEGKTRPPEYLTEPELISLMDANGIGTDATMAEHIAKIKERTYVMTQLKQRSAAAAEDDADGGESNEQRSNNRGGRGAGRPAATSGVVEFIPTTLGVALIEGYDSISTDMSLGKPFLRKEMEIQMRAICDGTKTRQDVVYENIEKYREVYVRSKRNIEVLKASIRKYVLNDPTASL